jgi:hypothetical protein
VNGDINSGFFLVFIEDIGDLLDGFVVACIRGAKNNEDSYESIYTLETVDRDKGCEICVVNLNGGERERSGGGTDGVVI